MANTIAVVGTGYVGLTTGACLSHLGHDVTCIDTDRGKIERIEAGVMPISEDGLAEIVAEGRGAGRLRFTSDVAAGGARRGVRPVVRPDAPGPRRLR